MDRSQLLKGTTELLILGVLRDGELYGYEIGQRIRERSEALIEPGEGWLYPALHRLERAGALEGAWRRSAGGPRRRYYGLTTRGRALLADQEAEWTAFARSIRLVSGTAASDG